MSLVDALKTPPPTSKGRKIDAILATLTGPEQQAVLDALSDWQNWPSDALARTLTDQGSRISEASIRRYRRDILGIVQ